MVSGPQRAKTWTAEQHRADLQVPQIHCQPLNGYTGYTAYWQNELPGALGYKGIDETGRVSTRGLTTRSKSQLIQCAFWRSVVAFVSSWPDVEQINKLPHLIRDLEPVCDVLRVRVPSPLFGGLHG